MPVLNDCRGAQNGALNGAFSNILHRKGYFSIPPSLQSCGGFATSQCMKREEIIAKHFEKTRIIL